MTLLLLPGAAAAATITVNSTGDTAANDGTCTLREAITSANTNAASGGMANECAAGTASDVIGFAAGFNGQLADTVAVSSALPAITTDTDIAGGQCMTDAGVPGPCAGVNGPSGSPGLVVDNVDNTSISGVAVSGALTGIDVIDSVSGFSATNDWLGVKLDGSAGANGTGLFIDPNSAGAQIGDATAAGRNVFAFNSDVGLDIEGADNNTIEGNYFGVKPNGTTVGSNPVDIEITGTENSGGVDATGNIVGGTLSAGQATTPACDGPCNVIDGAGSFGVDLNGQTIQNERPASLTSIKGNQIGLDATGAGEIPNTNVGIEMGGGDNVTVGGPSALDANHLVGGLHSIEARVSGDNQLIQNNLVGLNYAGTDEATSPVPSGSHGILVVALGSGDTTVTDNRIAGSMDDPIETQGSPMLVSGNLIGLGTGGESLMGGITGIDAVVGSATDGNTYSGNFIQNSSDSGIELQGANGATITGNTILGSAGTAGIWAHKSGFSATFSDDNTIGGDTAAEENVISGSNGPAIELVEPGNIRDVVARNTGSGNGGPFIDLGGDGLGNALSGPNGGIQAPVIGVAGPDLVDGTAQPGATVMLFSKAGADNGEIAGFHGSTLADPSGNWAFSFGTTLAGGSSVGATQTTAATGTSELAVATIPAEPGLATTAEPPAPADTDAPEATITKGPKKKSTKTKVKFRFSSNEPGSTFQCKLDKKRFKACTSPKTYTVKPGRHIFKVEAIDPAGNVSSPAKVKFRVLAG